MKVFVELRDNSGALVGVDTWGAVLDVGYSGAEGALTVRGSDGVGVRRKWYGSGTFAAVTMFPAGGDDYSLWPADAPKEVV